MDVDPGGVVVVVLEVALLAILWVRVRSFEAIVGEQSAIRIDAIRRSIDTMDGRRIAPNGKAAARSSGRRRRKSRKRGRRDS